MRSNRHLFLLITMLFWATPGFGSDLTGLWKGTFDGLSLVINDRDVELYQSSESFRYLASEIILADDDSYTTSDGRQFLLVRVEDQLEFITEREEVFLAFDRVDSLPPIVSPTNNPGVVFDSFWEAFAENYALFELTGTDWLAMRDFWRDTAHNSNDSETLFDIFSNMLAPLNDRHSSITRTNPLETYKPGPELDPFWADRENVFLNNIANNYLGVPLQSRFTDSRLRFGFLPDNIGYLSISSFLDSSSGVEFGTTLDAVLSELEKTQGLIVDLRFNLGGTSENTLALLERILGPENRHAYVRETRRTTILPEEYTDPFVQTIAPMENSFYREPLVVMTSRNSASGTEAVLLPMMNEPRIVQVGETTRGVFSKLLFRTLPNGWLATLSNERYYSIGGRSYEQTGVPPVFSVDQDDYQLDEGLDAGLEQAISVIHSQPSPVNSAFDIGVSLSGLWFDPERNGEGWHIQRVSETAVFVTFYSFDPLDRSRQRWVVGLGEVRDGRIAVERMFNTEGGRFGANSDEENEITERDWGRVTITFTSCDQAIAEMAGPDDYRGFVYRLQRIDTIPGLECESNALSPAQSPELDGSWYVASRPGEGWFVSHAGTDRAVVSWYTFDADGNPWWLIGQGSIDETGTLLVADLYVADGTLYGYHFNAGEVQLQRVGSLAFRLSDCQQGQFSFVSALDAQADVDFEVDRVLFVDGVNYPPHCL